MRRKCSLLLMTFVLVFSTLAFAAVELDDDYYDAVGIGEPGQSMSAGLRAAELAAYRKAAEAINEFQLNSESTVEQGITKNDTIHTKLNVVLRRARIIEEHKGPDGYFYATVRVPIWGVQNSVASAIFEKKTTTQPFPAPKFPQPVGSNSSGYTGLIVDCRGLGLTKAMSPVIKDDSNQPIYGYENLNYDNVVSQGMATYSTSTSEGVSRAGSNPLVVKAISVEGIASKCNPVVSAADASKILSANQTSHFLDKCAVVFVK